MPISTPAPSTVTQDAIAIWKAGVAAVDSQLLVQNAVSYESGVFKFGGVSWKPEPDSRLCVVGAGKAGSGMAAGIEAALPIEWLERTSGWINVPDDCVKKLARISLHGGRPAGRNEPTHEGMLGTQQILQRVRSLRPQDLCLALISGGGSALLPAPLPDFSLKEKRDLTIKLSQAGASIDELNCVRRSLSEIKGGGLARACQAGQLITLIISDVIGDPLETIASGPTVPPPADDVQNAIEILERHRGGSSNGIIEAAIQILRSRLAQENAQQSQPSSCRVENRIIGNNSLAVAAACAEANKRGYQVIEATSNQSGIAAQAGSELATKLLTFSQNVALAPPTQSKKWCLISGGETTVSLEGATPTSKGGRNQEYALSASLTLALSPAHKNGLLPELAIVSGGTDGEDGPTDAAGAICDETILSAILNDEQSAAESLRTHDSYHFFKRFERLLLTGPTHTNVMDLQVALVKQDSEAAPPTRQ